MQKIEIIKMKARGHCFQCSKLSDFFFTAKLAPAVKIASCGGKECNAAAQRQASSCAAAIIADEVGEKKNSLFLFSFFKKFFFKRREECM